MISAAPGQMNDLEPSIVRKFKIIEKVGKGMQNSIEVSQQQKEFRFIFHSWSSINNHRLPSYGCQGRTGSYTKHFAKNVI